MRKRLLSPKLAIVATVVLLVAGVGIVIAVAAPRASLPTSRDSTATRTYLRACEVLEQRLQGELPASRAALDGFVAHLAKGCPGVLRGAPRGRPEHRGGPSGAVLETVPRDLLVLESYKGLEVTLLRSEGPAVREFVQTVHRVSWSDGKLTNLIRSIVHTEAAWLNGALPNACHDMSVWTASGYRKLPSSTKRLRFGVQPISEQVSAELVALGYRTRFPSRDVLGLLRRYEHPGQGLLGSDVEKLEAMIASSQLDLLSGAMARIERALGLPSCSITRRHGSGTGGLRLERRCH
jgi:hypothetical protein